MKEIGILKMELQDYEEGNIIDIWDSLPLPPFHPLHHPTPYRT